MKLKNVHLPHPQPNGGFLDPSLGGGLVLSLCLAAVIAELSKGRILPNAAVRDVSSGVVCLLSWLETSAKIGA